MSSEILRVYDNLLFKKFMGMELVQGNSVLAKLYRNYIENSESPELNYCAKVGDKTQNPNFFGN